MGRFFHWTGRTSPGNFSYPSAHWKRRLLTLRLTTTPLIDRTTMPGHLLARFGCLTLLAACTVTPSSNGYDVAVRKDARHSGATPGRALRGAGGGGPRYVAMSHRLILALLGAIAVLASVLVVRAMRMTPQSISAAPLDADIAKAVISPDRLAGAIRIPTISTESATEWKAEPFVQLHDYLRVAFPGVHATLTREVVNGYSLLYTWQGSDTSLAPVLLMGHLDVVPVEAGTEQKWTHGPFSGEVADGYVWGRGTMDDKEGVVAILEAAELLVEGGFQPKRTIYFAFGHDEELGGRHGAAELSKAIQARTKRLSFLVDEGGMISDGLVPGVARTVAMIGVVEKASASVELTVERAGGHSSMPPQHTALGVLAGALTRLESHQMPARLTPVAERMFRTLAPEMSFATRLAMSNLWLLRPVVVGAMAREPQSAALVRTTTAVTMATGSPKQNVLPIVARGVVNFRILPGDTPDDVMRHVRAVVDDSSVHARFLEPPLNPSPVADMDGPEFALIARTISQVAPGVVTTPFLLIGGTDTRHYESLTPNVFRFMAAKITADQVSGAHGTNERLKVEEYARNVRFFAQLMRNAQ